MSKKNILHRNLERPSISSFLRVKALEAADIAMGLVFPEGSCSYIPEGGREKRGNHVQEVFAFAEAHHFFSELHPLIGVVTDREEDIWLTADLLKVIHEKVPKEARTLMVWEVLTKVLAYRSLKEGMELLIPVEEQLVRYRVDRVIWLEEGMPSFGLIPEDDEAFPSLLLFRGTELSWRGRRSIASDLDYKGVGYRCYQSAHPKFFDWFRGVRRPFALGYSLGGALAAYALLFDPDKVEGAGAFDPPGFSREAFERWEALAIDKRLQVFVTKGDCVSLYGRLAGTVRELSLDRKLRPITAHTLLITAQPTYYISL